MRKLLLNSTAIASVAAITASITAVTASVALADVSISAFTEFTYTSRSSQVTANDGTSTSSDSEIAFTFSNKTDSGLTVSFTAELEADEGTATMDEGSFSISGGFGKVVLGQNDGAADNYGFNSSDLIAEDQGAVPTSASISGSTDVVTNDTRKIAYHLPAMGGFTAGVSHMNSGNTGATDQTEVGAKYVMEAGGNTITINGSSTTTEATTTDTDQQSMGVTMVSGNLSFNLGQGTYQAVDEDRSSQGAAVSYKMANGMTVGAYTFKSEDDLDVGEEYSQSGVEASYTIAAGLTAVVNVDDYDYKAATTADSTGTSVADSGTISSLTIKASF
jgi:hypothetical protein